MSFYSYVYFHKAHLICSFILFESIHLVSFNLICLKRFHDKLGTPRKLSPSVTFWRFRFFRLSSLMFSITIKFRQINILKVFRSQKKIIFNVPSPTHIFRVIATQNQNVLKISLNASVFLFCSKLCFSSL